MKTLSEHNKDQYMIHSSLNEKRQNAGVKCDDCDVEMYLDNPYVALASWPMQQSVVCLKCNKRDYKVM